MAGTEETETKETSDSTLGTALDSIVSQPAGGENAADQMLLSDSSDPVVFEQAIEESNEAASLNAATSASTTEVPSGRLKNLTDKSGGELGLGAGAQQRSGPARELAASALVHLLGIATNKQLIVLEEKMDVINTKLSTLIAKLDKMSTQFNTAFSETYLDRIDFQLSEVRTVLRKLHQPGAVAEQSTGSDPGDSSVKRTLKP